MSAEVTTSTQPRRRKPGLSTLRDCVLAFASGGLLFASFPPRPLWFLAPLGVALLVLVLTRFGARVGADDTQARPQLRLRGAFGYGFLAGLGFLLPLLPWVGEYVGPVPWLALSAVEALFLGLFGVLAVVLARLPLAPLWIASGWTLTEWLRSSVPFGGFPWGRLAFGQADGWLLSLAGIGGAPLVSFAVALTGTGLAALAVAIARRRHTKDWIAAGAFTIAMPILAAALWPAVPDMNSADGAAGDRKIVVAAIQGSVPRLGLEFNAQRRAVLDNHVRETFALAAEVRAGRQPQPDVVIWPENASDIDPLRNADAADEIEAASNAIGAPILVGSVLVNGDGTNTNSVIVWDGDKGPQDRHDKKIIQPFGEYLPYRGFFRHFSSYADQVGNFVPGNGNGVVSAAGIPIGVATCYEVAFDRALTESVRAGAQLIAVPTNNATFGDTEMTYQQLAMSQLRAVEHGRVVVVAATSGVSAIIGPDGSIQESSSLFVPTALVAEVPLRTSTTLATRLGPIPEIVLCVGAALALAVALVRRRRSAAPIN